MIYNFTLTAGGKHGDRDTENGGKYLSSWGFFFVLSLCQQIPEWFPDFDYFSFCDCNNMITCRSANTGALKSTWDLVWLQGFGAMVHADAVFALVYRIIAAHYREIHTG